ncbi:hypothetical protein DVH24_011186 [Malus domestica]|uniref:Uncharacterized protein n=1 Tax=Malus domestica TaxID=3750 RepID=A0A498K0H8_MALDO|nr:hypothetical protein DVH24_011186 [Malus domestica]
MEPETSELPKGLLRRSTPLNDVGCYNPPPLGARHPHQHTSGQGLTLIPNCYIPAQTPTTSQARLRRSMILSALGHDHAITVLFLGTHGRTTSQWVIHHGIALARTQPETSKLPKGLVLSRDENIHIRLRGSTPLYNVRCYTINIIKGSPTEIPSLNPFFPTAPSVGIPFTII